MGLPDTYDVMWQCDRWLLLGAPRIIPNQLYKAVEEQQWEHKEFLPDLVERYMVWTGEQVAKGVSAAPFRGYGWRVWYLPDLKTDISWGSLEWHWDNLQPGLVGGVVYLGPTRRILQGKDPFYLEHGLPRTCPSGGLPDNAVQPKDGVWVTDEQMSTFRKQAVLSFGLE